ncbi:MAG: SufD family Fe-S cluster assembly protein [Candidatus Dependentiae bacterium]
MQQHDDWRFCKAPEFSFDPVGVSYEKQSFIDLSQGVGIYDTDDFIAAFPAIAQQYILNKTYHSYKHDHYALLAKDTCDRSYVLYVPSGVSFDMCIALPIVLSAQMQVNNLYIIVQQSSSITIAHDLLGRSINTISIFLEPYAQLTCIQKNKHAIQSYNHIVCYQQEYSLFKWYGWYEKTVYNHLQSILQGKHAHAHLYNGFVGSDDTTQWLKTMQHHQVGKTESVSVTKGLHRQQSHATHLGMIRIEKNAQQVVANQQSKFMLMDVTAQAHTIPSLEVLADDVQCAHGSAIGSFDKDILFYLQARGLSENDAMLLLEDAFFADVQPVV